MLLCSATGPRVRRCWTLQLTRIELTDHERIEHLENEVRRLSESVSHAGETTHAAERVEDGSLVNRLYSNVDDLQTNVAEILSLKLLIENLEQPVAETIAKYDARIKNLEGQIGKLQTRNNSLN